MTPGRARGLTAGERSLVDATFGGSVRLDRVRLWSCPALALTGRPFVAGGLLWPGRSLVLYPPADAREDFAAADTPVAAKGVFLHEMTHVWQSQRGVNLLFAKLRAGDRPSAYRYELTETCSWDAFNIEQQAMIVEDRFRIGQGLPPRYPQGCAPELYDRVRPFPDRGDRPFSG